MQKDSIIDRYHQIPETMIILGSGLGSMVNRLKDRTSMAYEDIFDFKTDASIGHRGIKHVGLLGEKPVVMMEGRRHYYEGASNDDMRLMIETCASIGVKNLILTNACGSMNPEIHPHDIVLITDHINMMGHNPLVGPNNDRLGPRFVDMTEPYDLSFRKKALDIAHTLDIKLKQGVYVSYLGPSYETKAEINAFRILGGDIVGMSTVPEVIVARHAEMRVLAFGCVTNMATGMNQEKLSHDEVLANGNIVAMSLGSLIETFVTRL